MDIQICYCNKFAIGIDEENCEYGTLIKLINRTGNVTKKGSVVESSPDYDTSFRLCSNELNSFGVVAEDGIADGESVWIWVSGSTCKVLLKDSTSATRGHVALAADTDGRFISVAAPVNDAAHWKQIGYVLESKNAGTDVLVLCNLIFN
jgi:hypothetical protein